MASIIEQLCLPCEQRFPRFCTVFLYSGDVIVPNFDTNFNLINFISSYLQGIKLHVTSILGQRAIDVWQFLCLDATWSFFYISLSTVVLHTSLSMDGQIMEEGSSRKRKRPRTEPAPTPGPSSTKKSRPATVRRPDRPRKPSDWHVKTVELPDNSDKTKVHTCYI